MANGDKTKAEERTERIAIRQGERTARKKAKLNSRTDRVRARHPQNDRMQETVDKANNLNDILQNTSQGVKIEDIPGKHNPKWSPDQGKSENLNFRGINESEGDYIRRTATKY